MIIRSFKFGIEDRSKTKLDIAFKVEQVLWRIEDNIICIILYTLLLVFF